MCLQERFFSLFTQPFLLYFRQVNEYSSKTFILDQLDESIRLVLKGNNAAFEQLYNRYSSRLMGVCLRYSFDTDEAKDLLQEVFIKIYEKLSTYRKEGTFDAWVHRIAINVAVDSYRKRQKQPISSSISAFSEYDTTYSTDDILTNVAAEELMKMVQQLSPTYRLIFNLYNIEGYKHHEIAKMLGISEGTSKSNLSDARKILQNKVKILLSEKLKR